MKLRGHKTKIVATIGPASSSQALLERLLRAGLSVARLNFSHGTPEEHRQVIANLRAAEEATGFPVTIMGDLPGPKMRLGTIEPGPVTLEPGHRFVLTTEEISGDAERVSMSFERLPKVVKAGDRLFLNDGLVQLVVDRVEGAEVICRVEVGGKLSSRKGLNLPGIDLGIRAFTEDDEAWLDFALDAGVDALSQSFVERADDLRAVREAARSRGADPFLVAKIERAGALKQIEEILEAADGIMVARGDLGVEVPIEEIAVLQKQLIARANHAGKPVITATQMLESMTHSRLPTRAEATDVANAILDGTDCVMLSAESAVGEFPVESVAMLARIASFVERQQMRRATRWERTFDQPGHPVFDDLALFAEHALESAPYEAVVTPTTTGRTARAMVRANPRGWILAVAWSAKPLRGLAFSYGVHPVLVEEEPGDWKRFTRDFCGRHGLDYRRVLFVLGPTVDRPHVRHSLELYDFSLPAEGVDGR